ncbi:MAG TPA: sugar ABC transporter permease, partial [Spirochaetia bacterium]|nr:sugar ABC transporter permease [Spirochaetia bacterium]
MATRSSTPTVGQALKRPSRNSTWARLWNTRGLLLMCLPAILFFLIFYYLPMPGAYLAFVDFNYRAGIFKSRFIWFKNFEFLLANGQLRSLTLNTILYNVGFIVTGSIAQILIALLLNELRGKAFRKMTQTVMFLPYFISYVLVGLFTYSLLSYDS